MSDSESHPKSLEEQLRELLQQANLSFMMPQGPATRAATGAAGPEAPPPEPDRLARVREFNLKPRDVRDHLDRFVIRQDDAKKVLSVAICDHYNHVRACLESPSLQDEEYAKHNVILLGPTGVGKTYLIKCAARLIGVPFVKADATKFSETGYVGHDVEDLVRDLVKVADGDRELAQYGIIFLDEVDKIASSPSVGKDVSGRGVQTNLLKLMEDTDVSPFGQTDIIGQMQAVMDLQRNKAGDARQAINMRHILFIVSGAFDGLSELVRKRVQSSSIGFAVGDAGTPDSAFLRQVATKDFTDYGFEPEFIGRLPVRVVCDPLTATDLAAIMLQSEGSVLKQYQRDFQGYGIALTVARDAIDRIAELAYTEGTGARGLMTVMERLFRDFKFELPSAGIRTLALEAETVAHPREALDKLVRSTATQQAEGLADELTAWAEAFEREHGYKLTFERAAIDFLTTEAQAAGRSMGALCHARFHDLEYGLRLIDRNTGRTTFRMTRRFVENPDAELATRIARSFQSGQDNDEA